MSKPCDEPHVVHRSDGNAHPDNKDPFDQRKAKPTDSTVPPSYGTGDAEGQAESKPVENECH